MDENETSPCVNISAPFCKKSLHLATVVSATSLPKRDNTKPNSKKLYDPHEDVSFAAKDIFKDYCS